MIGGQEGREVKAITALCQDEANVKQESDTPIYVSEHIIGSTQFCITWN